MMSTLKRKSNKVTPLKEDPVLVSELENADWEQNVSESKPSQRREFEWVKRDTHLPEAGNKDYQDFVSKRMSKLHKGWTPYLSQRKRNKHLAVTLNPTKGFQGLKYRSRLRWNSLKIRWKEWSRNLEIWRQSLKKIEGHQGTGVVSYFIFLKWLLFLNIFIFLLVFWVIVFFQAAFPILPYSQEVTGSSSVDRILLADNCSSQYNPKVMGGSQSVLDFIQGTGWMEKTLFFYGAYTNTELKLAFWKYNMPFAYFIVTLVVLVVSLAVMVHYAVSKYMDTILTTDDRIQNAKFFYLVAAAWDYSVIEEEPVQFQNTRCYHTICSQLAEQGHELRMKRSSRWKRCCLWFVRIFVNFIILVLLVSAAVAIYFAQEFSTDFTNGAHAAVYEGFIVTMVEYLPSTVIGVLNGVFPLIFQLLVTLEDYKPSFVIKITLLRTVFLRFASLIVILATIYRNISCYPRNECLVGTGNCPTIPCWETYVGQQIYKLVVMEFLADVLLTFLYELPRKLISTKCSSSLLKKIGPAIFDIPINVLHLVYAQSLCWLGFYFAPLLPAMCVIRMVILFYLKKLSALYNTVPPERPYHASRSNAFFMVILLIAFFMMVIPVGYVLVQLQPSPMCGPFRIYPEPTEIINIQIEIARQWFHTVWEVVTSSALIVTAAIIMALALYYCSSVRSANRKLVKTLRKQLLEHEKDKRYLLIQLRKYTNDYTPEKSKPIITGKDHFSSSKCHDSPETEQINTNARLLSVASDGAVPSTENTGIEVENFTS